MRDNRPITDSHGIAWRHVSDEVAIDNSTGNSLTVLKYIGKILVCGIVIDAARKAAVVDGKKLWRPRMIADSVKMRCACCNGEMEWSATWIQPGLDDGLMNALTCRGFIPETE